jgi:carboxyl-terminal processing protease
MLKSLDPYTSFLTPEEFQSLQENTSGHFSGVGIEIEVRANKLLVVTSIDDTPASRAGILSGDQIVRIDGKLIKDMDITAIIQLIKGIPGTKVTLTIIREGFSSPKDFILIRECIRINPIAKSMPLPGYGLVKIRVFTEHTEPYLIQAIKALKAQTDNEFKGLVLDLRNNPGGLLEQAVRVADVFIADGLIVETRDRTLHSQKDFAHKHGTEPNYPLVCLVNKGSASASEIVAGSLQDHKRALIMGMQTFGKGSVQSILELKDGSGLKLTVGHYYTPNHRSIHEQGIAPDVIVPPNQPDDVTCTQDLSENTVHDYQLCRALQYLLDYDKESA